jgi:hypothetical protein
MPKPIKCSNIESLKSFVQDNFPDVSIEHPTDIQTKYTFRDGLVMNIYETGTVNFQGRSHESKTKLVLIEAINAINKAGNIS